MGKGHRFSAVSNSSGIATLEMVAFTRLGRETILYGILTGAEICVVSFRDQHIFRDLSFYVV